MPTQQPAGFTNADADRRRQLVEGVLATGMPIWVRGGGWSMHPTIRPHERVLLEPARRLPKTGDIIAVRLGRSILVHRLIRQVDGLFYTRGDGSNCIDKPTAGTRILAIATAVERDGRIVALCPTLRHGAKALAFYSYYGMRRILSRVFNVTHQAGRRRNR
jgi:hypothetical protein